MEKSDHSVWYKEKWAWFALGILLVDVVFALIFVAKSIDGADDVVKSDYYKDGLAINQDFRLTDYAAKHGLTAQIVFTPDGDSTMVKVTLNSKIKLKDEEPYLELDVIHPVKEDLDRTIVLILESDGSYVGELVGERRYRHYLRLMPRRPDAPWQLKGEINFDDGLTVNIGANE